ncbi:MAG: alpha/beta hydrolase [Oscillospiraceae bacterium]|nr:alpha/beta hydrolase [Oscillospiraceae bacterium]
MSKQIKTNISFLSANKKDTVQCWLYEAEETAPKAVVQLSHGMCEYIGRYEAFIEFLVEEGFAVCGNDHLGHGETSGTQGIDGYFAKENGAECVIQDLRSVTKLAQQRWPGLSIFLLGHSMGSFLARKYAAEDAEALAGLILSGTGGPNPAAGPGMALTRLFSVFKGDTYRSAFINKLAFGAYLKRIDQPDTPYDWITRDKEIVKKYAADPKCTFVFTLNGFHEMMKTLKEVNRKDWGARLPKELPVLLFSGTGDPVGQYGEGVRTVYENLKRGGVKDVTLKLYPDGRHEMLNEINRQEVYQDVCGWLQAHIAAKKD